MAGSGRHAAKTTIDKKLIISIVAAVLIIAAGVAIISVIGSLGKEPEKPDEPTPVPEVERFIVSAVSDGTTLSQREYGVGSEYTVPDAPEGEDGAIFDGWKDASGKLYKPGDKITVTGTLTLTAQWTIPEPEIVKYKVKIESENVTLAETELEENAEYTVPDAPESDGLIFLSWMDGLGGFYQPGDKLTVTADITLSAVWEEPEPPYDGPVNPLTGMPTDVDFSGKRPYAVMLNNIRVATPQAGISKADIIYECLVEGGITRFMGVFQTLDEVPVLGSVRSARPCYVDIAQGLDAIYIHAGGSPDAYTQMKNRSITHIDGVNGTGETFYRDAWRRQNMGSEHSLMLDSTKIPAYIEKNKLRTDYTEGYEPNMTFADEAAPSERSAKKVTFTFSTLKTTTAEYDEESGLYKLSQYKGAMTDSVDGSQVAVRNVIGIYTYVGLIAGDEAGRLKITLSGSGSGYFACDGCYTEINWKKASNSDQFEFTLADGTPITFGRGSTYIAVLPTSGGNASFE